MLLAISLAGFALDQYAYREHLHATTLDDEERREQRKLRPVVAAYVTGIVIGLAFPVSAVWLYLGIAVYLVVPLRGIRRPLHERA